MSLARLSATDATAAVRTRAFTAEALIHACVAEVDRQDPDIKAWAYFNGAQALGQARAIDEKVAGGEEVGKLAGVPVGIKDVFNTRDMPTQMGSPIWRGFESGNDARVVYYLRMADAVIMGKTVTAEFAVHTLGPTHNPHDLRRSPGTSSSGSAAAVAAGMVPLALGTQTAGSIIRPASYCGIYGFKPSFGLIPRTAVLKTTDTLDTIGMFARTVEDLGLLFDVVRVRGRDFPKSFLNFRPQTDRPWRVAIVPGPKWDDAEPYAQKALFEVAYRLMEEGGFTVEQLSLPPGFEVAHDVHATIYDKTLAYYFREEFKQHTLVSPIMYDVICKGNEVTLDRYKAALKTQRVLAAALDGFFERFDVIVNLSTGGEAPLLGEDDRPDNCLIWTMCGLPAVSVPAFRGPNGLPYGVQVVGRRFADYRVLQFCTRLGEVLDSLSSGTHASTTSTKADPSNGSPIQASRQEATRSSERHAS